MRLQLHSSKPCLTCAETWSQVLGILLAENARSIISINEDGSLPLHLAARHGSIPLMDKLLRKYLKGASVADAMGRLPLHVAVSYRRSVIGGGPAPTPRVTPSSSAGSSKHGTKKEFTPGTKEFVARGIDRDAMFGVVKILLDVFPRGVAVQDSQGHLPLNSFFFQQQQV
jgi:ankyrin repeat protein